MPAPIPRSRVHEGRNAAYGDICFTHIKFPSFFLTYLLQAFLYNARVYGCSSRISFYTICDVAIFKGIVHTPTSFSLLYSCAFVIYNFFFLFVYFLPSPSHALTISHSQLAGILYHISYSMLTASLQTGTVVTKYCLFRHDTNIAYLFLLPF